MPSSPTVERLTDLARQFAVAVVNLSADISADAEALADRIDEGRFEIAVVGEFKSGKSTLINALVGRPLLPTGVLPLTAVVTEVRHGPEALIVIFADGRREQHAIDEVAHYVTEKDNPHNERGVDRAIMTVESDLLAPGLVLVDTPGLGSVHTHNTEATDAELDRLAGAIVVLSAEAPCSEQEAALVERLARRSVRTFFVLNRVDTLDDTDVAIVADFVSDQLAEILGSTPKLYCLSARDALLSKPVANDRVGVAGFAAFERAIRDFAIDELGAARLDAARRDLNQLARRADELVRVQTAALALEHHDLDERIDRLTQAIIGQQDGFDDDALLLRHARDEIRDRLAAALAAAGHAIPVGAPSRIASVAAATPMRALEITLDQEVETIVRTRFDAIRSEQETWCNSAWQSAADAFRARVQHRVDEVRAEAGRLFRVEFQPIPAPSIPEEHERFFYLFLHLEGPNAPIARVVRHLLPPQLVRRRLKQRALRRLTRDLDKHAGRVRVDLTQRLNDASDHYIAAMREQLKVVTTDLQTALERGRVLSNGLVASRKDQSGETSTVSALTRAIEAVTRP